MAATPSGTVDDNPFLCGGDKCTPECCQAWCVGGGRSNGVLKDGFCSGPDGTGSCSVSCLYPAPPPTAAAAPSAGAATVGDEYLSATLTYLSRIEQIAMQGAGVTNTELWRSACELRAWIPQLAALLPDGVGAVGTTRDAPFSQCTLASGVAVCGDYTGGRICTLQPRRRVPAAGGARRDANASAKMSTELTVLSAVAREDSATTLASTAAAMRAAGAADMTSAPPPKASGQEADVVALVTSSAEDETRRIAMENSGGVDLGIDDADDDDDEEDVDGSDSSLDFGRYSDDEDMDEDDDDNDDDQDDPSDSVTASTASHPTPTRKPRDTLPQRRSSMSQLPPDAGGAPGPRRRKSGRASGSDRDPARRNRSSRTAPGSSMTSPSAFMSSLPTALLRRQGSNSSFSFSPPGGGRGQGSNVTAHSEGEILAQIQELQVRLSEVREAEEAQYGEEENSASHMFGPAGGSDATGRVVIVSNRLPVTISKGNDGQYHFEGSSGGLVSAMRGFKADMPFLWVGWPGAEVDVQDQEYVRRQLLQEHNCYPVFLTESHAEMYYNGFCNDILWPLFHYVPLPIVGMDGERKFDFKYWHAYATANHKFAEAVMQIFNKNDRIWVQDYHLMLLPQLLRKRQVRRCVIGFFLHTPFPSSEVYRILPVRREVLQGVLEADLIGFHTYEYARHFLSVCTRILGLETTPKGVQYNGHFADVGIFPIGIDSEKFLRELESPAVKERIEEMRQKFAGKRVLLGVDRLDYIKGVPHKLLAFESLLTNHPEWKEKAVLVQIAVPSRTEVEEYKKLSSHTHELVGRINGYFGSVDYVPIVFINQSVKFHDLCALYSIADVAVVTPIRDGMNLVSYEYVMCQKDTHGVLVLSEFAGSAQSLSGAIRVNPWNIEEVAAGLDEALSMTSRERQLKHWKLYRYVKTHTAEYWAKSFVQELGSKATRAFEYVATAATPEVKVDKDILPSMKLPVRRLILLEYEGGLCAPHTRVEKRHPDDTLRKALQRVTLDPMNKVYIYSGRSKTSLDAWFGDITVGLIAEHGCDFRRPGETEWNSVVDLREHAWREEVLPIMQYFTERTPGSFLETKENVITWHFMDSDPHFGSWQGKELRAHLAETCSSLPVEVTTGFKTVEVRPVGVSLVSVVRRLVQEFTAPEVGFVFVLGGGDRTDEELFAFLETDQEQRVSLTSPPPERIPVLVLGNSASNGVTGNVSGVVAEASTDSAPKNSFYLSPDVKVVTCRVGASSATAAKFYVPNYSRAVQVVREVAATVKDSVKRLRALNKAHTRSVSTDSLGKMGKRANSTGVVGDSRLRRGHDALG